MRLGIVSIILTAIILSIGTLFWYQEGQYLLPTPLPEHYTEVAPKQFIMIDTGVVAKPISTPTVFHFFNPDCPCSRFNLNHFISLEKKYGHKIKFYAVVTDEIKLPAAQKMVGENIVVVADNVGTLAKACGVYSTPQAAILQSDQTLFYRGNYNRARYCTDKNSNYVQMALDSLLAKRPSPHFGPLATKSYGCVLNKKEDLAL